MSEVSIDSAFQEDFANRWLEAWNSHSTDTVLELLHPDIHWNDPVFWPHEIVGREGVREYTDKIWQAMPDVRFEEIQRFVSPDHQRGLVLFRQFGSGPAKLAPEETFDTHGCDIFLEFRDGRLSKYLAAYEIVTMMQQLGALPPRGDRMGGAYLLHLLGAERYEAPTG